MLDYQIYGFWYTSSAASIRTTCCHLRFLNAKYTICMSHMLRVSMLRKYPYTLNAEIRGDVIKVHVCRSVATVPSVIVRT